MKVVISHDIDHWRWRDHLWRDLFIPKYVARTGALALAGGLHWSVAARRFRHLFATAQHNLDRLLTFNRANGVPATFFVAVERGLSLSYSTETAGTIVRWLQEHGEHQIGLHGMAFDQSAAIRAERRTFADLAGHDRFGIRMHYLRAASSTLSLLEAAGYPFSSNTEGCGPPARHGRLTEFPIGVMDVRVIGYGRNDVQGAVRDVLRRIAAAERDAVSCFTVNFHDCYFCDAYPDHRAWYEALVRALRDHGHDFTSFTALLPHDAARP